MVSRAEDLGFACNAGNFVRACGEGSLPVVKSLLKMRIDIDAVNEKGETGLMEAAYLGKVDMVRFLLGNKAMVNRSDSRYGNTSLGWAACSGRCDVIHVLAQARADPNITNRNNITPIIEACLGYQWDAVRMLITQYGAHLRIDTLDHRGRTIWGICSGSRRALTRGIRSLNKNVRDAREGFVSSIYMARRRGEVRSNRKEEADAGNEQKDYDCARQHHSSSSAPSLPPPPPPAISMLEASPMYEPSLLRAVFDFLPQFFLSESQIEERLIENIHKLPSPPMIASFDPEMVDEDEEDEDEGEEGDEVEVEEEENEDGEEVEEEEEFKGGTRDNLCKMNMASRQAHSSSSSSSSSDISNKKNSKRPISHLFTASSKTERKSEYETASSSRSVLVDSSRGGSEDGDDNDNNDDVAGNIKEVGSNSGGSCFPENENSRETARRSRSTTDAEGGRSPKRARKLIR